LAVVFTLAANVEILVRELNTWKVDRGFDEAKVLGEGRTVNSIDDANWGALVGRIFPDLTPVAVVFF